LLDNTKIRAAVCKRPTYGIKGLGGKIGGLRHAQNKKQTI
jgi:hypothetical protein